MTVEAFEYLSGFSVDSDYSGMLAFSYIRLILILQLRLLASHTQFQGLGGVLSVVLFILNFE